jgi:hypothetical protein
MSVACECCKGLMMGQSLVHRSPVECVCVCVCAIRCNNNTLHLQWVGRWCPRQRKQDILLGNIKNVWAWVPQRVYDTNINCWYRLTSTQISIISIMHTHVQIFHSLTYTTDKTHHKLATSSCKTHVCKSACRFMFRNWECHFISAHLKQTEQMGTWKTVEDDGVKK